MGQVTDDQGNAVPDVRFYTTGALPRAFFRKDASFSLVLATRDTTAQVDTLRRLDITCVGPMANAPEPISWMMKDQYAHFYLPGCGPNGAEYVHPYHRVIYPEIYDHIDMHLYSGRLGQKLAFVINPGGDPKEITLLLSDPRGIPYVRVGNVQADPFGEKPGAPGSGTGAAATGPEDQNLNMVIPLDHESPSIRTAIGLSGGMHPDGQGEQH